MTTADKAESYDELLSRAKMYIRKTDCNDPLRLAFQDMFPELAETEEEKIKKKVIEVLKLNIQGAKIQMMHSKNVDRTFEIHACSEVIKWLENKDKGK